MTTFDGPCPNCGRMGSGVYCDRCGRRRITTTSSLRDLVLEGLDELAGIERRFFRTTAALEYQRISAADHVRLPLSPESIVKRHLVQASVLPALALSVLVASGSRDQQANDDERDVIEVVERFLRLAGRYDLDSLPLLFAPDANIGASSQRDGEWVTSTWTFDEWLAALRGRTDPRPYTEPVSEFTVHVDNGRLAFVRADATLMRDGQARSHNIDYFTLLKLDGTWKILNGSYTAVPSAPR